MLPDRRGGQQTKSLKHGGPPPEVEGGGEEGDEGTEARRGGFEDPRGQGFQRVDRQSLIADGIKVGGLVWVRFFWQIRVFGVKNAVSCLRLEK